MPITSVVSSGGRDPALKFNFEVVSSRLNGGFSKIGGISEEIEVVDQRDGTDPLQPRKLVGASQGGTLTLEKGILSDFKDFIRWFDDVRKCRAGIRSDISILIGNCDSSLARAVKALNAWPSSYEIGELDASSSEVAVESITLVFEGLEFIDASEQRIASERPATTGGNRTIRREQTTEEREQSLRQLRAATDRRDSGERFLKRR